MAEQVDDQARQRLARAMEARLEDLSPATWRDVAKAGGITYETIRKIRMESGDLGIRSSTRRGLEKGLRVVRGSVDEVLAGTGEFTPEPEPPKPIVKPSRVGYTRAAILAAILDELAEEWGEEVLQEAWSLRNEP